MSDITLDEQLACVRREIGLRQRVYPKWVKLGKMTEEKAGFELAAMQAVLETLLGGPGGAVLMRDTPLPESACPYCAKVLDAAFHPMGGVPEPGALSLCIQCGEVCEFGADLELIRPSDEVLAEIDLQVLQAMRKLWAEAKDAQASAADHSR